jgi:RNA polymerase sigma-70 factor (ECF subfamily)
MPSFEALYDTYAEFIHRGARRLGVDETAVEDVVQEVFIVVSRRLSTFRQAASARTWLYGILLRVARHHRRTVRRSTLHGSIGSAHDTDLERVPDRTTQRPDTAVETRDAYRLLLRILDELDEDKREIFVLAELEQLPVTEIAELLDLKLNTAYSRLRLARAAFDTARHAIQEAP